MIDRFFTDLGPVRSDVRLGVGDDCALLTVPAQTDLAVSLDTLCAGVHFFPDCAPHAVGHKSLAVGLSDLAAMGATPAWATLALTLPRRDDAWVGDFARGFRELAEAHGVRLVGGDTTRGPLSVTVQVHGLVASGTAVRRSGACVEDLIWVSGTLGDAALALDRLRAGKSPDPALRARLERPTPRVTLGVALRGLASAMIDLSDGLAGDLGHILAASGVGALIDVSALPLSPAVRAQVRATANWTLPVAGGDDYELCFSAPARHADAIRALGAGCGCPLRVIGRVRPEPGLQLRDADGTTVNLASVGYDHFTTEP
nr:thiamine-phosphate kinase [Thiocapsa imhoffii]